MFNYQIIPNLLDKVADKLGVALNYIYLGNLHIHRRQLKRIVCLLFMKSRKSIMQPLVRLISITVLFIMEFFIIENVYVTALERFCDIILSRFEAINVHVRTHIRRE